jgi:hypothetical protein
VQFAGVNGADPAIDEEQMAAGKLISACDAGCLSACGASTQ